MLKGSCQLLLNGSIAVEQMNLPRTGMPVLSLAVLTPPIPEESWFSGKVYG